MVRALILLLFGIAASLSFAQTSSDRPIQDNSFLVEEAYNQERGVVQHISNFQRSWTTGSWMYTFTHEWPFNPAPRHQLSYTVPLAGGDGAGLGDIQLNYRYQWVGNGDARVAFAPRFTLVLPTGDWKRARGSGALGYQTNLPLSIALTRRLVTHWNAGATITPEARNLAGDRAGTFAYNFGQSFIFLAHPNFNLMFETVANSGETVVAPRRTEWTRGVFVNPGARWALNFPSGLQIVPGVAVPIGVGPSAGEKAVFFYISFEHPFGRAAAK